MGWALPPGLLGGHWPHPARTQTCRLPVQQILTYRKGQKEQTINTRNYNQRDELQILLIKMVAERLLNNLVCLKSNSIM